MFFEFPTKEDWRELENSYPFEKLEVDEGTFRYASDPNDDIGRFFGSQEIFTWIVHLQNRLIQVRWSYVLLHFYFNKGIPDDEWFISPGKAGQSIQYYPHFTEKDHLVKAQFDYYVDAFYHKMFSAWDTLGHLINGMYGLEIERASFDKARKKLKTVKPALYADLKIIADSSDFKKMRELRDNVTHNHLPGDIGSSVRRVSKTHITFGGGDYTPSAIIKENVSKSLDLFAEALNAIKKQNILDNPS